MGKHRKNQHYRRIVVAAAVVGAVGVPSVAMACTDWGAGGGDQLPGTAADTAGKWQSDPEWGLHWEQPSTPHPKHHSHHHRKHHRTVTAPSTPTASATAKAPTAPTAPSTPKTTAPTTKAPTTPSTPSTPKATATASGVTARVIQLVNAERAKVGCSALTANATLAKAAQAHSADMAAHQNMSHTGSDGSSPGDRITRAGYSWSAYGENVAYGYSTPEQVMAGWMSSPGHRANILNCSYKEIGVGLAQPNSYWTQDFGTPR